MPVESNAGVGDCDRAAQKATEGVTNRQTDRHTTRPLYDDVTYVSVVVTFIYASLFLSFLSKSVTD